MVLRCSRVADASSLCQTCHELHADGLPLAVLTRARVADSVAIVLSPKGPLAAAWLQAGVSSETVEAMRANVWRWLDQCARLGGDADLIGLALVRLSVKLALTSEHARVSLAILGDGTQKPELCSMEYRLVNTLWI